MHQFSHRQGGDDDLDLAETLPDGSQ